jgi:hypothetical protein
MEDLKTYLRGIRDNPDLLDDIRLPAAVHLAYLERHFPFVPDPIVPAVPVNVDEDDEVIPEGYAVILFRSGAVDVELLANVAVTGGERGILQPVDAYDGMCQAVAAEIARRCPLGRDAAARADFLCKFAKDSQVESGRATVVTDPHWPGYLPELQFIEVSACRDNFTLCCLIMCLRRFLPLQVLFTEEWSDSGRVMRRVLYDPFEDRELHDHPWVAEDAEDAEVPAAAAADAESSDEDEEDEDEDEEEDEGVATDADSVIDISVDEDEIDDLLQEFGALDGD